MICTCGTPPTEMDGFPTVIDPACMVHGGVGAKSNDDCTCGCFATDQCCPKHGDRRYLVIRAQAKALQKRVENLELVSAFAKDITDAWPTLTLRGLGAMTNKVNALREALDLAKSSIPR